MACYRCVHRDLKIFSLFSNYIFSVDSLLTIEFSKYIFIVLLDIFPYKQMHSTQEKYEEEKKNH